MELISGYQGHVYFHLEVLKSAPLKYNSKAVWDLGGEKSISRLFSILLVTKHSGKFMENNINDKMYHLLYISSVLCISNASIYLILTKILQLSGLHIFTKMKTEIRLRSNFLKSSSLSFHSIK